MSQRLRSEAQYARPASTDNGQGLEIHRIRTLRRSGSLEHAQVLAWGGHPVWAATRQSCDLAGHRRL